MKITLVLLITIFALSASAYSQTKIGVISAQEIMSKSKKGLQIQRKLENLRKVKAASLKIRQERIKQLEKELLSPALNTATRERKGTDLQSSRTSFKRMYEDAQRELERESQKMLLQLEKELMPMIASYGKTNGFTVIYDRARSGIVYSDAAIDITNDLIRMVDAQFRAATKSGKRALDSKSRR